MSDLYTHVCHNCGPKAACLFTPSELLKGKYAICRQCRKKVNQRHAIRISASPWHGPVPLNKVKDR